MGFLIAAAQSQTDEELRNALQGVRVLGNVHTSGPWRWALIFYLHSKELNQALSSYEACSLSAYAGDSVWKLGLFGLNQPPFSLWFDASLATELGIEKARTFYEGKTSKLARQFGLSEEERQFFRTLSFEEALSRLLDLQVNAILDAFQRFSILHDPSHIREILLNPTADELDSELGNLPRLLEGIGLTGIFDR
jgi:hypothetical protein